MRSRATGRRWSVVAAAVAVLAAGCTDSGGDSAEVPTTVRRTEVASTTEELQTTPAATATPSTAADTTSAPPESTIADTTAVETTAPPATDATTTTTATATAPMPDLAAARLPDPAVVIPLPVGFERAERSGRAAFQPIGNGNAKVHRPPIWGEVEYEDGGYDAYGDNGWFFVCHGGYCATGTKDNWMVYFKDGSVRTYGPEGLLTETPPTFPADPDPLDFTDLFDADDPVSDAIDVDAFFDVNPPAKPGGGGAGEPHYRSADGVWFSSQVAGELVARTGDPGHGLQIRQEPYGDLPVAIITAVAAEVGEHRVTVLRTDAGTDVFLDGDAVALEGAFTQVDLDGGGAIGIWTDSATFEMPVQNTRVVVWPTVAIVWPDLGTVRVASYGPRGLDVTTDWTTGGSEVTGLLGSADGDPGNDLTGRDGFVADPLVDGEVVSFVESWRVLPEESLFAYASGESTETFTIAGFPSFPVDLTPGNMAAAEAACSAAGLPQSEQLARCAFDIAATGEEDFAATHVGLSRYDADVIARAELVALIDTLLREARGEAVLELTEADVTAATSVEVDTTIEIVVAAGETRTLVVATPPGMELTLVNEELSCPGPPLQGDAAYQLFSTSGTPLAPAVAACDEPDSDIFAGDGPYYLKATGPASGDAVTMRLRFRAILASP